MNIGCSSQGGIEDLRQAVQKYSLSPQSGLISGSSQGQVTAQGYRVSASLGSWSSGLREVTPQGYEVLSSVQGNISSETSTMIILE